MTYLDAPTFVWKRVSEGRSGPGNRSRHALVHDPERQATSLYGGVVWKPERTILCDTWELSDGSLGGLVMHGGEAHQEGPRFDVTAVLKMVQTGEDSSNDRD